MKHRLLAITGLLALVGLLAVPVAVHAAESNMRSGTSATVSRDETVDATAYLAGGTVSMAGDVRGDLYCAGQSVEITGTVEGDVFCAGQTVNITGRVTGSVHVAGQAVTVSGPIGHSLTALGQNVTVSGNAVVGSDATVMGATVQMSGKIGRDLVVGGQDVTLSGAVDRNVTAYDESLTLLNGAKVGGGLEYTSKVQVVKDQGARVMGQTQRHEPKDYQVSTQDSWAAKFWSAVYWFLALLVTGLVLLGMVPRSYKSTSTFMIKKAGWALLAGFAGLILAPLAAVLLMITFLGLPLGFALLALWLVAMLLAYVYSGYALGTWVSEQAAWKLKWPRVSSLGIGLLLIVLLALVPFVGGLLSFLALVWGLGGMVLAFGSYMKSNTKAAAK